MITKTVFSRAERVLARKLLADGLSVAENELTQAANVPESIGGPTNRELSALRLRTKKIHDIHDYFLEQVGPIRDR